MTISDVTLERQGSIAVVSFNRPEKLNAVNPAVLETLKRREQEIRDDHSIRAVVLTGKGRAFCAGADLSGGGLPLVEGALAPDEIRRRFPLRDDTGWPDRWFGLNLPVPVVAAVNGPAVGYGAEVLGTCDMRVAAESARIGWVFARRGLVTDLAVGPVLLPRIVGLSQASRLLFSGEIISAAEALRIGLVDELVPDGQCLGRAIELARHLASGAPGAIAVHKRQLYASLRQDPCELFFENREEFDRARGSEDYREGVRSFLDKRAPVWSGN